MLRKSSVRECYVRRASLIMFFFDIGILRFKIRGGLLRSVIIGSVIGKGTQVSTYNLLF
jgi:hypothetical protein